MASDARSGIAPEQRCEQCGERFALLWRAGVGRRPVRLDAAYVGHSDASGVVSEAVRSGYAFVAAAMHRAVERHHVMVSYLIESALAVPAVDLGHADVAGAWVAVQCTMISVMFSHIGCKVTQPEAMSVRAFVAGAIVKFIAGEAQIAAILPPLAAWARNASVTILLSARFCALGIPPDK